MSDLLQISLSNLFSPMVLFFALGLAATRMKSDLEVPEAIAKGNSLYLMLAIGFKGGEELSRNAAGGLIFPAIFVSVLS